MLCHEVIVVEMTISLINSINLVRLPRTEPFVFIETPDTLQQTLATQHFVNAGDATVKTIGRIEERSIAVSDFHSQLQKLG
jgi:hypothetical protein